MKWIKIGKTVNQEGSTVIYEAAGTDYRIESRKRHIPHAGGRPGTWEYTSYFVLKDGQELAEKNSMADAKAYAEQMEGAN